MIQTNFGIETYQLHGYISIVEVNEPRAIARGEDLVFWTRVAINDNQNSYCLHFQGQNTQPSHPVW